MNKETLEVVKKALEPHPDIIMVYCAWCGLYIEAKLGKGVTGISHGLCKECSSRIRKEMEK
jgi:transposase-like protein